MTLESSHPSAELTQAATELLDQCQIVDVRTTRIRAEVNSDPTKQVAELRLRPTLEFLSDAGVFSNRFGYLVELRDEDRETVATLEFTLVVDWSVPAEYTPRTDAADFVAATTGYFAAYPYVRELVHSNAVRLGLDPVILGCLRRDTLVPSAVTIETRTGQMTSLDEEPEV